MPTTLGGGACGHLGLNLDTVQYVNIPATALYTKPTYPGPLNIVESLMQYQITKACDVHQKF
eukprot:220892-Ditylum_brightwellii.AAC.1